jgi:serine/threonine protein kinase
MPRTRRPCAYLKGDCQIFDAPRSIDLFAPITRAHEAFPYNAFAVAVSPLSLPPIGRFGRFDILGRVALGGMAEIFLAREVGPGRGMRPVVIKRILPHVADDPRFVEMFLHEAELAMNLNHPNLCTIYEFGAQDNEYFIAMEWVFGVSITQMHKHLFEQNQAGIEPGIVARIACDVADALHYAHQARDAEGSALKLVHRDVTPDNIMVGFDGKVKLLDFGVAKAASQRLKTETGMLKGKFAYMSPEQYQGKELDGRADVFSLGACMYEAVTGLALFHRASEYETMGAIMADDPAPSAREAKPALNAAFDAIIARALSKSRETRYASAGELQTALDRWLSTGPATRAPEVASYVGQLCSEMKQSGPSVDARRELWTRESPQGEKERAAMRDALAVELDRASDDLEAGQSQKSWLVRGVIATIVLGLLALVMSKLFGAR